LTRARFEMIVGIEETMMTIAVKASFLKNRT